MDERAVEEALALDAQWVDALRRGWLVLMEEAVWAQIHGARPGVRGRLRKRVLETGERLRSLTASRDWIPRPRERLKNALASAMSVDEALVALEHDTRELQGAEVARLERALAQLRAVLAQRLPDLKARWAKLLESR
jgi:hypothetical protein